MGEQNHQERRCKRCGTPITEREAEKSVAGDDFYCRQCLIEAAEKYIADTPETSSRWQRLRGTRFWKATMAVVLLASVAIIAAQAPRIWTALKEPKPIRVGSNETDESTDKCISNLWRLGGMMPRGKLAEGKTLTCPASGKPYMIVAGVNAEAHCPNPGLHGFRDIMVSKTAPVPMLKK